MRGFPASAFVAVTLALVGCAVSPVDDEVGDSEGAATVGSATDDDGTIRTQAEAEARFRAAKCLQCHAFERKVLGPSFRDVATETARRSGSRDDKMKRLVKSVRYGSRGNWELWTMGPVPMPANEDLRESEAKALVGWILDMGAPSPSGPSSGPSR